MPRVARKPIYHKYTSFPEASFAFPKQKAKATSNKPAITKIIQFVFYRFNGYRPCAVLVIYLIDSINFYYIVNSAEKIITSCIKWINHAQKIPLVSSIDFANNHPKKPATSTPTNPPGLPQ